MAAASPMARVSRRVDQRDASTLTYRDGSRPAVDEPVPYSLTGRAAALFVVDTANVAELRLRCPELYTPRRGNTDTTTRTATATATANS